jgi:hypothetical protein
VLVRPPRLAFAELKSEHGEASERQLEWMDVLRLLPQVEVYLWRPRDWETIVEVLTGTRPRKSSMTRPTAAELLATPEALLTRTHLRELGLDRRAVDAVFRACRIVALPGYSRSVVRVRNYLALLDESIHDGRTRVR